MVRKILLPGLIPRHFMNLHFLTYSVERSKHLKERNTVKDLKNIKSNPNDLNILSLCKIFPFTSDFFTSVYKKNLMYLVKSQRLSPVLHK